MANQTQTQSSIISDLRDRLTTYMERKGLRSTAQRRLVTEVFFRSKEHLSIEDLLAEVRKEDPKVGYATVYRTLKLLKESGLAYERNFGGGVSLYEVAHENEHHDHLICVKCGLILEFEDAEIEQLQEQLAKTHGFELVRHTHELYGYCSSCIEKKDPSNSAP
ncbi:MAG: Fur family transcriptional regulator [Myxococcota bacterium]